MIKIKKIISFIFICILCMMITSCKNKENNNSNDIKEETKLSKEELTNIVNAKMYNFTMEVKDKEGSRVSTSIAKINAEVNGNDVSKMQVEVINNESMYYDYQNGKCYRIKKVEDKFIGNEKDYSVDDFLNWQEATDILIDEAVIDEVYDSIVFDKDKHSYSFTIIRNKHEINYEIVISNKQLVSVTAIVDNTREDIIFSNIGTTVVQIPNYTIE